MPNHITNCLTIKGTPEKITELRAKVILKNEDKEDYFSFKGLIPPPENMFNGNLGEKERADCKAKGIPNWYDWQIENWGTKWCSYEYKMVQEDAESLNIEFQTAWSPPKPIFTKLEEMGFKITGLWKDECSDDVHSINDDCGDWWVETTFRFG